MNTELEELKLQKKSIEEKMNNRIRILKLFLDRVSERDLEKNDIPHYIEILCECGYFVKLDEDYHKLDREYRELIRNNQNQ